MESPRPSLEQLAADAGVDYWTAREWLEREVDRRQRERYRMHERAIKQLDARLVRLAQGPDQTLK